MPELPWWRKCRHQFPHRGFAESGGIAFYGLRFFLAFSTSSRRPLDTHAPMAASICVDGAPCKSPDLTVPSHRRSLELATRAQDPKVSRGGFHCAFDLGSQRNWIIGMTTNENLILCRALKVDGEDGVIEKARGLTFP